MIEYLDLYPDGDKNSPLPLPPVPRPTRYTVWVGNIKYRKISEVMLYFFLNFKIYFLCILMYSSRTAPFTNCYLLRILLFFYLPLIYLHPSCLMGWDPHQVCLPWCPSVQATDSQTPDSPIAAFKNNPLATPHLNFSVPSNPALFLQRKCI